MIRFLKKLFEKLSRKQKSKQPKRPIEICPEAVAYLTNPRND